jgi:hypothetical protein
VHDPAILPELALMSRELDRSEDAGETHDKERDPGRAHPCLASEPAWRQKHNSDACGRKG